MGLERPPDWEALDMSEINSAWGGRRTTSLLNKHLLVNFLAVRIKSEDQSELDPDTVARAGVGSYLLARLLKSQSHFAGRQIQNRM